MSAPKHRTAEASARYNVNRKLAAAARREARVLSQTPLTCARCLELKTLDRYNEHHQGRESPICKDCVSTMSAERYRANRERILARHRAYYAETRETERHKAMRARYRANSKEKIASGNRRRKLKRKYDLTIEQYAQMRADQGNVCAICQKPETAETQLHVDHDHETGQVRQLLCAPCNKGLGHFMDTPELLEAAAAYLREHKTT